MGEAKPLYAGPLALDAAQSNSTWSNGPTTASRAMGRVPMSSTAISASPRQPGPHRRQAYPGLQALPAGDRLALARHDGPLRLCPQGLDQLPLRGRRGDGHGQGRRLPVAAGGVPHNVVARSDDLELIEINLPAAYGTFDLEPGKDGAT